MDVFTIGVFGYTKEEFFGKLQESGIDTFVDIRRRRAVRGAQYAFVNSQRLQDELSIVGINYVHVLELAPLNETRDLQRQMDKKEGILKRSRSKLGEAFVQDYKNKTLSTYNLDHLMNKLQAVGARRVAFFCVEKEAEACHRSLVTDKIQEQYSIKPKHL